MSFTLSTYTHYNLTMNLSFSKQIELVLEDGQKSGTHKFAFIRGIIDYAIENNIDHSKDLKIPLIHIALNHINYYWKLFLYDVKQVSGGSLPYYKYIERLCIENEIDTTEKIESKLYELNNKIYTTELSRPSLSSINKIRSKIIDMPAKYALILKDHNLDFFSAPQKAKALKGKSFKEVYSNERDFIIISRKHLRDLDEYKTLLAKICILHWAALTDKYTKKVDSGIKYLETPSNERKSLEKFFRIYTEELQITKCSYCEKRANSVDHVYPFRHAKRDEFWNMLPACKSCNSKKSDKILEISKPNQIVLKSYIKHVLSNYLEDYLADLKYRAIIDKVTLTEVSTVDYLFRHTFFRCR